MKIHWPLLLSASILCWGCKKDTDEQSQKTVIHVLYPEISLCDKRFVEGDTLVWQNFQIRNVEPNDLHIAKIELRGDSQCAFNVFREPMNGESGFQRVPEESTDNPAINMVLPYGHGTLFRVEYVPSREGIHPIADSDPISDPYPDHATLVITSNADVDTHGVTTEKNVVLSTGEISEDHTPFTRTLIPMCGGAILPATDGGVAESCPESNSGAGSLTQVHCKEPLPMGAPGCR